MTNYTREQIREAARKSGATGRQLDEIEAAVWVVVRPEDSVPKLPTEPYTVIRVAWSSEFANASGAGRELTLHQNSGSEYEWVGWDDQYHASNLADYITGFEVLSEPRPVTAKAVIERVRELDSNEIDPTEVWDGLAREFGVES